MSRTATSSLTGQPGPIEDDPITCQHGHGPILPSDPGSEFTAACDNPAIYRVPWPGETVMGVWAVCPWHLWRALNDHDDSDEARLVADFDAAEYVPEFAWLTLNDVPTEIEISALEYYRLGLDQRGKAHYYRAGSHTVIVTDHALEPERIEHLEERPVRLWLRYVRDERGWAGLDDRVTQYVEGWE